MSRLLDEAKTAVTNLYSDTGVDPRVTRAEINELEEFIMERLVVIEDAIADADAAAEAEAKAQAEAEAEIAEDETSNTEGAE